MHLIGINGFKTSGKDTVYAAIKRQMEAAADKRPDGSLESLHLRVERRAFADNLKIMAAKALGYEGDDTTLIDKMNDFKEGGFISVSIPDPMIAASQDDLPQFWTTKLTGREYLQNFGAKAREVFGEWFWVDQVVPFGRGERFNEIWRTQGRAGTDTGTLPAIGCITDVRYPNEAERVLDVDGIVLEVIRPGIESDGHDSERPLPPGHVTYRIVNDGTLDDLEQKVAAFLGSL